MIEMKVGVTTVSFSSNQTLTKKLNETGLEFKVNPFGRRLTKPELIDFLQDCDSAIIGLDKIDASLLEKCPELRLISKYGVGLDNIDFDACEKFQVEVRYPLGVNKRSVSEMALAMMLCLARNIYVTSSQLKSGNWNKSGGFELSGKNVGIIGYGNVGKDLALLLKPFGVNVLANDIEENAFKNKPDYVRVSSKEEIFAKSDFISVHTPLSSLTSNLVNRLNIPFMKDGVILINTARGGIFNQDDVYRAMLNGKIGGLGIDAYEVEPPENLDLISLPQVICTPHIGGNSHEAVKAMGEAAIQNLF